jgi:hypothetical protein
LSSLRKSPGLDATVVPRTAHDNCLLANVLR